MNESKFIFIGLSSFSLTQIMGIVFIGYGINQIIFIFLILCFIAVIPGCVKYGILQRSTSSELKRHHAISCFIPSFIAILILSIGFFIGIYIAF